jgi:hypothetical protein
MSRGADFDKAQAWRDRLARFAGSGISVARFCSAERVSVATFYYWKQKLSRLTPGATRRRRSDADQVSFLPVQFADTRMVVEVALPNGAQVRVPANDARAIRAVVKAAGQLRARIDGEAASC